MTYLDEAGLRHVVAVSVAYGRRHGCGISDAAAAELADDAIRQGWIGQPVTDIVDDLCAWLRPRVTVSGLGHWLSLYEQGRI